jgi:hypothetical protein
MEIASGRVLVGLLACLAAGCVEPKEHAIDRASREFDCAKEEVRSKFLGYSPNNAEIWKIGACGNVVTYFCTANGCVTETYRD